jgi:hypothetical protein
LLLRNEGKYALNGATGIFFYSFTEEYVLLCLKNPLSANYDVGQNVQSVKIAVSKTFRRSKDLELEQFKSKTKFNGTSFKD